MGEFGSSSTGVLEFTSFPQEVIDKILGYLHWPTDHCHVSLVSRSLYHSAIRGLYSTLIIAPHRVEAMLSLLRLVNSDPVLQGYVKTLLFEDTIVGRDLETERKLANGPLAEEWPALVPTHLRNEPEDITKNEVFDATDLLAEIFPKLCHLHRIVVRYLNMEMHYHSPLISSGFGISDIPKNDTLKEFFHSTSYQPTSYPNVPYIRNPFIFKGVTTICLCAIYQRDLSNWSKVLGAVANTLECLAIMHCRNVASVIGPTTFPHLTALELHQANLGSSPHPNFMGDFFKRHPSLEIIAMVTINLPNDMNVITHFKWLRLPNVLPNLHTLRLKDPLFAPHFSSPWGDTDDDTPLPEVRFDILESFILEHPKLIDVVLFEHYTSGSLVSRFADLKERLATSKTMKKNVIMAGWDAQDEYDKYVCRRSDVRSPSESWWAYKFFFTGLKTIERSGYRPKIKYRGVSTEV